MRSGFRSRLGLGLLVSAMAAGSLALPGGNAAANATNAANAANAAGAASAGNALSPPAATPAAAGTGATIVGDAQQLLRDIDAGRGGNVPPDVFENLLRQGRVVLDDVSGNKPQLCAAESALGTLRKLAAAQAPYLFAMSLDPDSLNLQALILSHPGTAKCGGVGDATVTVGAPVAKVVSSDNKHVRLHVVFPTPVFATKSGGGSNYVELFEPGFGNGGTAAIGTPELPVTSESVAVPIGASASVKVLDSSSYTLSGPLIWPVQPSGAAAATAPAEGPGKGPGQGQGPGDGQGAPLDPPPPFTVNPQSYLSDTVTPARQADTGNVGSMRGLHLTTVSLAGATYLPIRRVLRVFTSMDIQVSFQGRNTGSFGDSSLTSPWNLAFANLDQAAVVNWKAVTKYLRPVRLPRLCGEEMMVVTSSALKPAATTFAADRTAHGVLTRVFTTDGPGGIGTSALAIWATIDNAYTSTTCIRPSYVTLLGDTSQVPTFEISLGYHADSANPQQQDPNFYEDPVATDMPFGFLHQGFAFDLADISDFNQDVLVGRIPAPDLTTASREVTAITNYDDTPPNSRTFYSHVTATAFFQPCGAIQTNCGNSPGNTPVAPSPQDTASFLRTSEFTAGLAAVAGKTVNRVTSDESNNDTVSISPQTFDNGQAITSGLTFDSSSSDMTSTIQQDVNNGSFLLWHSDHGYTNGVGWYEPPFAEYGDVDGLTSANGLPVVWSSDCDSGKFDAPNYTNVTAAGGTPAFGPYLLETAKAVGFVGASRESPIYNDGYMLQGMGANLFPEEGNIFLALFGAAPKAPVVELGALLDAAKNYMVAQTGSDLSTNIGAIGTVLEYNDFGDPSTVIRRDRPRIYLSQQVSAQLVKGVVHLALHQSGVAGGVATLVRNGHYVGRGVIGNGRVTIQSPGRISSLKGLQVILAGDRFTARTVGLRPTRPRR